MRGQRSARSGGRRYRGGSGLKKNIASLDVNKDAGQIKTLTTQLDSLQRKYDNIRQTFDQRFNVAQLVGLHEEMQKVDNSVDRMNAKIADSSNAKQAQSSIKDVTQLYKELASTASKIGETKIKIAGSIKSSSPSHWTFMTKLIILLTLS